MNHLSVYIIAYNEADKIEAAIESVSWADEIVVADSFSTDRTAEIATLMGAKVVQIPFNGFGDLRNKAVAACSNEWIFSLDSDERCTDEVRDEIVDIIGSNRAHDVWFVPRRNIFMGRWLKCFYPDYRQPQLFRKGALTYKPDPVHEGFVIKSSRTAGYLKNSIWQVPFKNLEEVQRKTMRYSSLSAVKMEREGRRAGMASALLEGLWAFIHMYILKRSLLDGWPGFVIALGNFEGTFYKYAKLYEKNSVIQNP